jgi:hypothetical protein
MVLEAVLCFLSHSARNRPVARRFYNPGGRGRGTEEPDRLAETLKKWPALGLVVSRLFAAHC